MTIHDTTTGLNYLNNRYQDPTTGVFISVDPLVATTGMPYLYGDGNPVTFSDPSGLCSTVVNGQLVCGGGQTVNLDGSGSSELVDVDGTPARVEYDSDGWIEHVTWRDVRNLSEDFDYTDTYVNAQITEAVAIEPEIMSTWEAISFFGGFVPVAGEGIDSINCVGGDGWSCSGIAMPFVGGKLLGKLFGGADEIADGVRTASKFGNLTLGATHGIKPYRLQRGVTKGHKSVIQGTIWSRNASPIYFVKIRMTCCRWCSPVRSISSFRTRG